MPESLPEIYLDESGNTGPDLGNVSQPVYALGSILAHAAWDEWLAADPDVEWKWSSLAKSSKGQDTILGIVAAASPATVKTAIADKKYMAVAKMVDELIEPLAYETGFDFYGTSSHIGATQFLYVALRGMAGEAKFNALIEAFVKMMRTHTTDAFDAFYGLVDELAGFGGPVGDEFSFLRLTRDVARDQIVNRSIGPNILSARPGTWELDPGVPLVTSLAHAWSKELRVPHRFIHDDAGVLEHWKPFIERMSSLEREPTTISIGDKQIVLPTLTIELSFAESSSSRMIQLADILAGATRYLAAGALSGDKPRLWKRIEETGFAECVVEGLWFVPPDV
jgi:Protein of unknown function (DUF3800)